jgi:hypothetical protein
MRTRTARLFTVLAALLAVLAVPVTTASPAQAADTWNPPLWNRRSGS